MRLARRILLVIADMGLPAATEMLEPITPQYIADLITLASIGARTTESPTHRQMASGLSMPVGYKNGTDGSLQVAIDALFAARNSAQLFGNRRRREDVHHPYAGESLGTRHSPRRPLRPQLLGRTPASRRRSV